MKHYTYRITNIIDRKHYYGVRSADNPYMDLGIKYFSSSRDSKFIDEQKNNPENFRYKVVSIYDNREEAMDKEIRLHSKFNVSNNPHFYNRCNATTSGFSVLGNKHTKESLLKISAAGRRPCKTTAKEKISKANKNQFNSLETRKKKSEANKGILANKFKGYYIYKNKKYITAEELSLDIGLSKSKIVTISRDLNKIISKSSYSKTSFLNENFNVNIVGKSWKDIGFNFINITK